MKAFIVLMFAAGGAYLLYLSTSVRWADFGPICLREFGCADAFAVGLGALLLAGAAAAAWWME